jgi:hypothetical protein
MLELLAVDGGTGATPAPAPQPAAAVAGRPAPRAASAPVAPQPAPAKEAPAPLPEPDTPAHEEAGAPPSDRVPAPAPAASGEFDLADLRARWAEVIDRASPVIKPLLKECRPVARDGARLTLAFPEGRDFMRANIARRAGQIESLLTEMFGGSFAIECVASNLELEPLTVEQAVGDDPDDPEARALLEGVLKITGGELVDAPEVR